MNRKKIIEIDDLILEKIFSERNYDNSLIRVGPRGIVNRIIVPKELTFSGDKDVEILFRSPFKDQDLMRVSGLTFQELFDIVVLHIKYLDERPKCSLDECGNYLRWSGRFTWGYGNSQVPWSGSENHYCNHSCSCKRSVRDGTAEFGKFKFGVCSDPSSRFGFNRFTNHKIIKCGSRVQMANLEYWTKYFMKCHREYLDFNSTMYEFRKAYIRSLDCINIDPR